MNATNAVAVHSAQVHQVGELQQLAARLMARARGLSEPRMLSEEAPDVSLERLLELGLSPKNAPVVVWAPKDGPRWVGFGAAAQLKGASLDSMSAAADLLLRLEHEPAGGLRPKLFCSMTFEQDRASVILPRWRYTKTARGAYLSLVAGFGPAGPLHLSSFAPATARLEAIEQQPEAFVNAVQTALQSIARGEVSKVVLSHSVGVRRAGISLPRVFARLADESSSTRFLMYDGEAFVGASPELLFSKEGLSLRTEALAGSAVRAEALYASDKELREHRAVLDYICGRLEGLTKSLNYPETPQVRALANIVHLLTPIHGVLRQDVHPFSLVGSLHPTPAVLGLPPARARSLIKALEPGPRGYYAGPVGWLDGEGNGAFHVALRSARIFDRGAQVYAGAGIVSGSVPKRELEETQIKAQTMLRALGV